MNSVSPSYTNIRCILQTDQTVSNARHVRMWKYSSNDTIQRGTMCQRRFIATDAGSLFEFRLLELEHIDGLSMSCFRGAHDQNKTTTQARPRIARQKKTHRSQTRRKMCRFAIGYHHICPLPMAGAREGGCGRKFFSALAFMSERGAIHKVIKHGGESVQAAVRQYLKAKTSKEGYDSEAWSELRTLPLEDICDTLCCADMSHRADRWDYWEPTRHDSERLGVEAEVFRRYCYSCDFKVKGRFRLPEDRNVPEDIEFKKVPPFAIGERRFDRPYPGYEATEEDEWRATKEDSDTYESDMGTDEGEETAESASGLSTASETSGSTATVTCRPPPSPTPPPPPPGVAIPRRIRRDNELRVLSAGLQHTTLRDISEESEQSDVSGSGARPARSRRTATGEARRPRRPTPEMHSRHGGRRGLHDGSTRLSARLPTRRIDGSETPEGSASDASSFF